MEFAPSEEWQKVHELAEDLFRNVLDPEEKPFFVSDEATLLDVSGLSPEELIRRCTQHYGTQVTLEDL